MRIANFRRQWPFLLLKITHAILDSIKGDDLGLNWNNFAGGSCPHGLAEA